MPWESVGKGGCGLAMGWSCFLTFNGSLCVFRVVTRLEASCLDFESCLQRKGKKASCKALGRPHFQTSILVPLCFAVNCRQQGKAGALSECLKVPMNVLFRSLLQKGLHQCESVFMMGTRGPLQLRGRRAEFGPGRSPRTTHLGWVQIAAAAGSADATGQAHVAQTERSIMTVASAVLGRQ